MPLTAQGHVLQDVYVPEADLRGHVAHALTLGLSEAELTPSGDVLSIIANGPSAETFGFGPGDSAALNGALAVFTRRGLAPTYWAACDPGPIVCNFLKDAPAETVYLVASKCHPAVFSMLADRRVMLWHVDEDETRDLLSDKRRVTTASSVTVTAFELFARWYADLETYGWDGCYLDGKDHAAAQEHHRHGDQAVVIGPQTFDSTRSWAQEGTCARMHLHGCDAGRYPYHGLTIHGPGMFGALMRFLDLAPRAPQQGTP